MQSGTIRDKYNETQHRIVHYLLGGLSKGNTTSSRSISQKRLGLSAKEVGTNMAILSEICQECDHQVELFKQYDLDGNIQRSLEPPHHRSYDKDCTD